MLRVLNRLNSIFQYKNINLSYTVLRSLSVTPILNLKEIKETKEGNKLILEGVYVDHPRADKVLNVFATQPEKCSICALGVEVKHTDVLILSQFLRPDGCMLPRRVTGLCRRQQKNIGAMVTMAQKAGLMPNIAPAYSKKDPEKRNGWKKYNKYFDESTIFRRKTEVKKSFIKK